MSVMQGFTSPLCVIEAPGKIGRLKLFLDSQNLDQVNIAATKGRLYDLPETNLGINISWHEATERVPLNPANLAFIASKIKDCDSIWILTDNDDEGEWIAEDVFFLAGDHAPEIPVLRGYFHSLDEQELGRSLAGARPYVPGLAEPARARRIFDREVGYLYSKSYGEGSPGESHGTVGRVITPCLSAIATSKDSVAHLVRKIPSADGSGDYEAVIGLSSDKAGATSALLDQFATLPEIKAYKSAASDTITKPNLWDGKEAMLNLASELRRPIKEIANDLESLYLQGKITYPRTESSLVSETQLQDLDRLAKYAGANGFSSTRLATMEVKSAYLNQGAHSALIPAAFPDSLTARLESLSNEDQVHLLLTRNVLNLGNDGYQDRVEHAEPEQSPAFQEWAAWINEHDLTLQIVKKTRQASHWQQPAPISVMDGVIAKQVSSHGHSGSWAIRHANDYLVAKHLVKEGLCRTSTLAAHADKISRRYLTDDFQLNDLGQSSLERARQIAGKLLDPNNARELTRILTETSVTPAAERVAKAFSVIEMNPEERDGKNSSFDMPKP